MNDTFLGYIVMIYIALVSEDIYSFTYGFSDSLRLPFLYTCS